jgi:hypothetical protein
MLLRNSVSRRRDTSRQVGLSPAARKQARYRQRQRKRQVMVLVAVTYPVIDTLISAGWLTAAETRDKAKLSEAAKDLLDEWARRWPG